jgi:hypothetical protein
LADARFAETEAIDRSGVDVADPEFGRGMDGGDRIHKVHGAIHVAERRAAEPELRDRDPCSA